MSEIPEFLKEKLEKQYGKELVKEIIRGYESKRPVTLRVNTLKTTVEKVKKVLEDQKISYKAINWSKEAFILEEVREKSLQDLEIYQNGEIYLQSLSSMLPPILLNPKPNTDILDMAAAPGGKTTQMAALTNNLAHITACELNKIRAERLVYNLQKQGASSVYVMQKDARNLDEFFSFNQILLDAPCSGSGTLQIENGTMKENFTEKLIQKSISSQKALLKKAISVLKTGGEMVYSTCSILKEENEEIILPLLKEQQVEICPIQIENLPLLPTSIKESICIAPNELYEGFFVVKLRKL
ncbi:MAG: RsmB/NOP family class I SAM-dependent RNA methyltransferase [Clostridia bacterium]|nr:RsmB/NOP family class I SAM-dependent RNA methyltransferase [Clostridia bacterium]